MSFILALQVSTLTMQVEELKKQVEDSSSEEAIKGTLSRLDISETCPVAMIKHFYIYFLDRGLNYACYGSCKRPKKVFSGRLSLTSVVCAH